MSKRHPPKYETRSAPPLSDGRTPGVCKNCGKQHPSYSGWETDGNGCAAQDAVLPACFRFAGQISTVAPQK